MIPRLIGADMAQQIQAGGRIVLLFGARQVGKTTLTRAVLEQFKYKILYVTGDDRRTIGTLSSRDLSQLRGMVTGYDVLFVDEAQRIPEIGINLKLLIDHVKDLRIIATGSSSLDLASQTREALTGRTWVHTLYPIAIAELATQQTPYELNQQLENRLLYGGYPALFGIENSTAQRDYLQTLVDSYLYKDILEMANICKSQCKRGPFTSPNGTHLGERRKTQQPKRGPPEHKGKENNKVNGTHLLRTNLERGGGILMRPARRGANGMPVF